HGAFCCRAIIVLAADFNSEDGSAFEKAHACPGADMVRCIRAKYFPMWQVDMKARAVWVCSSLPCLLGIVLQTHGHLKTSSTRLIPARRHVQDLPVDQFSLALHFV